MGNQNFFNAVSYTTRQSDSQVYLNGFQVFHKYDGKTSKVLGEMLEMGILDQLVDLGFIPPFEIEKETQQNRITFVQPLGLRIFPKEWPFSLIAEAGAKLLHLLKFLDSKGYGLLDCHPYNFVLFNGRLMWVDLGSFERKRDSRELLFNEPEFLRNYVMPLKIARSGMPKVARAMLAPELTDSDSLTEIEVLTSFRLRIIRQANFCWRIRNFVVSRMRAPFRVNLLDTKRIIFLQQFIKIIFKMLTLGSRLRIKKWDVWLKKTARTIDFNQYWSNYAQEKSALSLESSLRFNRISEVMEELSPETIIDIGGNSGTLLSKIVSWKNSSAESYTVLDYDDGAIERGRRLGIETELQFGKDFGLEIHHFYFDFANPWLSNFSNPLEERLQGEIVLALALTHHLLLGQHMDITILLERLNKMTLEHLLIEFMPLGIYSGGDLPKVPEWYTVGWFKQNLSKFFIILHEERLEENRMLFVAKKI